MSSIHCPDCSAILGAHHHPGCPKLAPINDWSSPMEDRKGGTSKSYARDACKICNGDRGGVPGNENVVDCVVMCDYCHADQMRFKEIGKVRNAVQCWQRGEKTLERAAHFLSSIATITGAAPSPPRQTKGKK